MGEEKNELKSEAVKKKFKDNKIVLLSLSGIILAPFILIPAVAFILKLGLLVSSILPKCLIFLEIDTSETVSISTFIYYYTCFLAIEVTAILSYVIYRLGNVKEEKDKNLERVASIKAEIANHLKTYTVELYKVGIDSKTIQSNIQDGTDTYYKEKLREKNLAFSVDSWERNKLELINLFQKNNEDTLIENLKKHYRLVGMINENEQAKYLDKNEFENFDEDLKDLIIKLESISFKILNKEYKML